MYKYSVQVPLQEIAAAGRIADANDALTLHTEDQPAGYYRVVIFSAAMK